MKGQEETPSLRRSPLSVISYFAQYIHQDVHFKSSSPENMYKNTIISVTSDFCNTVFYHNLYKCPKIYFLLGLCGFLPESSRLFSPQSLPSPLQVTIDRGVCPFWPPFKIRERQLRGHQSPEQHSIRSRFQYTSKGSFASILRAAPLVASLFQKLLTPSNFRIFVWQILFQSNYSLILAPQPPRGIRQLDEGRRRFHRGREVASFKLRSLSGGQTRDFNEAGSTA